MGWRLSERANGARTSRSRPAVWFALQRVRRHSAPRRGERSEAEGVVAESYEAGFTHPENPNALRVKHVAPEQLLAASGQENFSEAQWLEQEIKRAATDEEAR